MSLTPFDYINDILQCKKNIMIDEVTEKGYNSFIVNRGLSFHFDCIEFVNRMNNRPFLDKKMQYHFLLNTIRSYKRKCAKWYKPEKSDNINLIKEVYGYSDAKARDVIKLIDDDGIKLLQQLTEKGGIAKRAVK